MDWYTIAIHSFSTKNFLICWQCFKDNRLSLCTYPSNFILSPFSTANCFSLTCVPPALRLLQINFPLLSSPYFSFFFLSPCFFLLSLLLLLNQSHSFICLLGLWGSEDAGLELMIVPPFNPSTWPPAHLDNSWEKERECQIEVKMTCNGK